MTPKKILGFAVGISLSISASAGIPISEGNVQQRKCGASRIDSLYKMGTVIANGGTMLVKDRRANVGKALSPGDVVFYVSMSDAKKTYITEKQIEIVDSSPLTPDVAISPQDQIKVTGAFISGKGRKYDLISVGEGFNQFFAMVDDSGFICSDRFDDHLVAVGAPTTYQEFPLKAQVSEPNLSKPRLTSVAITYMGGMGATASFEVAIMINGLLEAKKVSSFDVFSPSVKIGDMALSLSSDGGKLTVTSIDEPADFQAWLAQIRPRKK